MKIKELIAKVKEDWSSWLVIAAVLTAGTNFGQTMTQLNYQITDLSKTVAALSEAVKEINTLDERVTVLENRIDGHKNTALELLKGLAEEIIISNVPIEEIYNNTVSKYALETVCNIPEIKYQLYDDLGSEAVIYYCTYIR